MRAVAIFLSVVFCCPANLWAASVPSKTEDFFRPPPSATAPQTSIKESIQATFRHYRELRAMQENRQAAVHEVRREQAGWGPRLDATGGVGASYLNDSTTRSYGSAKGMHEAGRVGLTLTQPLWNGLSTNNRVNIARSRVESLDNRVIDNATMLALEAVISHVDLNRRRMMLDYAQRNVKQHLAILSAQSERQHLGASTMADVTQVEGRLARAQAQVSDMQAFVQEGEEAYTRLTGLPAPANPERVTLPAGMPVSAEDFLVKARTDNPKVRSYLAAIQMAQSEQKLTTAAFQPVVNLEAGPNYSDRGGHGSQWESSFDVMLVGRWNLFNSGADKAAYDAAAARYRQTHEEALDYDDTLKQQIKDSWTRYLSSKEQEQFYAQATQYNLKTRDAFLEQFMAGERSLLDVLDAAAELYNSATQHVTAAGNIQIATYRMQALSGGLLNHFGVDEKKILEAPADLQK